MSHQQWGFASQVDKYHSPESQTAPLFQCLSLCLPRQLASLARTAGDSRSDHKSSGRCSTAFRTWQRGARTQFAQINSDSFLSTSFFPSICLFIYLSNLSIYLSNYLSTYPSIHSSIHPSIHPSLHLSLPLSIYLSTYLSIYLSS